MTPQKRRNAPAIAMRMVAFVDGVDWGGGDNGSRGVSHSGSIRLGMPEL
jgi:hypothetical protein